MDKLENHKYKQMYCEICDKTYGINYYYTHKKISKKHINKIKKESKLLKTDGNDNEIRNVKVFLLDMADQIQLFLEKEDNTKR